METCWAGCMVNYNCVCFHLLIAIIGGFIQPGENVICINKHRDVREGGNQQLISANVFGISL